MLKSKKDWTKLDSYVGLSLEQIQGTIQTCGHMLAFGEDKWAVDVVRTFEGYGGEAGLAVLVSALFLKKHGAGSTAVTAAGIYMDIARELNNNNLMNRVRNLEYMVYFADHGMRGSEWPIVWPYEDVSRRAGLAHVMLGMALKELENGTTSEQVAALGIQGFLVDGSKLKDKKDGIVVEKSKSKQDSGKMLLRENGEYQHLSACCH